jgi:hypothetical protein
MLEGGAAGSGKTDWQRWVAYQLIRQGYHVWILDLKGYSFFPFEGIPNVTIAKSLPASLIMLEQAQTLLEKRKEIIDKARTREVIKSFVPLVIMIDEAASLAPSQYPAGMLKEQAKKCDMIIGLLGCQSREPKIFVIYGTQRPDMTVINKQFKANVEASVAFRTKDHFNSQIILDRAGAEKISPDTPGRCIYSHGKDHLLQVPFIGGDTEWDALLNPLKGERHAAGTPAGSNKGEDFNRILKASRAVNRANRETDRKFLTTAESELLLDQIKLGKIDRGRILPAPENLENDEEGTDLDRDPDDQI